MGWGVAGGVPAALARMKVVDIAPLLRPEHYFDLDDHLRASGHELVAHAVVTALAHFGEAE